MSAPFNSHELKILWNIKANEVLMQALKRSPPREHNLLWLASLAQENRELKSRSLLYEPFQIWVRKYNPDQPRVPAGNSDGGQWTDAGGSGVTGDAHLASGRGRFGGAVAIGRKPEIGPKAPDGTVGQLVGRAGGRVPVDQGSSSQPATKFTGETRTFITRHAATAQRVADKLGVSRNAVIGAVANEYDTRNNPDLALGMRGGTAQAGGDWWVSDSTQSRTARQLRMPSKLAMPIGVKNGEIQQWLMSGLEISGWRRQIDLLKDYDAQHIARGDDPLHLASM